MRPRFLSQKMLQKEPLKKMPSTHAHATSRSAKLDSLQSSNTLKICSLIKVHARSRHHSVITQASQSVRHTAWHACSKAFPLNGWALVT